LQAPVPHEPQQRRFIHRQICAKAAQSLSPSVGDPGNRNEPAEDDPFPDAWCDNCEIIRVATAVRNNDGWNEESEKLAKITMLCSECYERARIRNTRTDVTEAVSGAPWLSDARFWLRKPWVLLMLLVLPVIRSA